MQEQKRLTVLDKGYVDLIEYLFDERLIAKIARISHGQDEVDTPERMLKFLLKKGHTGPFEASLLIFKIKAPIFVFRQWMRHRIGMGFTEKSLRYCEAQPEFYCPHEGDEERYMSSWNEYKNALIRGEKREVARRFLPVGLYSEAYWYVNFVSFRHFLHLRAKADAQYEMQCYAYSLIKIVSNIAPISMSVLKEELVR